MIIAMKSSATEEQIEEVCESIRRYGYKPHVIRGEERVVIGAVGHGDNKDHLQNLRSVPGVEDVVPILQPYKIVGRELKPQRTIVRVGDLEIGGKEFVVMAGPCSVESREQILASAKLVAAEKSTRVQTLYRQSSTEAEMLGVFGAPTFVVEGELFWGQDRLEFVDRALEAIHIRDAARPQ